jgi:hypothetical protein
MVVLYRVFNGRGDVPVHSKFVRSGRIVWGSMVYSLVPLTWRQVLALVSVSVVTGAIFRLVP